MDNFLYGNGIWYVAICYAVMAVPFVAACTIAGWDKQKGNEVDMETIFAVAFCWLLAPVVAPVLIVLLTGAAIPHIFVHVLGAIAVWISGTYIFVDRQIDKLLDNIGINY